MARHKAASDKLMADRARVKNYEEVLKKETVETFRDVPDEVRGIRVTLATNDRVEFEW